MHQTACLHSEGKQIQENEKNEEEEVSKYVQYLLNRCLRYHSEQNHPHFRLLKNNI